MGEKQKIQGVDNKELLLFGVIIGILVILLIFEMFFFDGRESYKEDSQAMQEKIEEMQNTTVASEQRTVYHALNDIVEMMNNKNNQGLYDMLKDDYKNYYFSDYETFEQFITAYASQKYYPKYTSYYRDGNLYYIMVEFLKAEYTRDDLLAARSIKVDTIVLEEMKDGNFKFAMNGFIENVEHTSSKTIDGVTFSLKNTLKNTETAKTTLLISNDSNKILSISTTDIQPEISGGNSAKISVTSSITLEPGEFGLLSLEYYLQYNSDKELRGIRVDKARFDDGTLIENVYLSK